VSRGQAISALLMLRRVWAALPYAVREESFGPVFGAGAALVISGTLAYALCFSVSTLTTTSVSDPDLVLDDGWIKIFTIPYQIIGIGILVEILRRLGLAFVAVQARER
jgi:hypothetical protein